MNIPIVNARKEFTSRLVDQWTDFVPATKYLQSMFRINETDTKYVDIEVVREFEKVAVDVLRGHGPTRLKFDKGSFRTIEPPLYNPSIDHNSITRYDEIFSPSATSISVDGLDTIMEQTSRELVKVKATIDRAYEIQAAQVLQTGIVTLDANTDIDFKRKAASKVDGGAGTYWTVGTVDPTKAIEAGCIFIREKGKSTDAEFRMTLGAGAFSAMKNNTIFKETANLRRADFLSINMPARIRDSSGATFHGVMSAGSYTVQVWTYPQSYDTDVAVPVATPYIENDKMIITPLNPHFTHAFGATDRIARNPQSTEFPEFIDRGKGAFTMTNYMDAKTKVHVFEIASAGICVPTAVDQIYTQKVIA